MNFNKMTPREQTLTLVVGLAALLVAYGLLRLKPALAEMDEKRASMVSLQAAIKNTKIPDPPAKTADVWRDELKTIEQDLPALREESKTVLERLAPADSPDLQIRISELARKHLLSIRDRKPYDGKASVVAPGGQTAGREMSALEKKRAQKRIDRAVRQAMREGRNPAEVTAPPKVEAAPKTALEQKGFDTFTNPPPGSLHDLTTTLSTDAAAKRPLQQFALEGDFRGLQRFIADLEQLPWLVTVVKLDVAVAGKEPPSGLPQPLLATLVLAF